MAQRSAADNSSFRLSNGVAGAAKEGVAHVASCEDGRTGAELNRSILQKEPYVEQIAILNASRSFSLTNRSIINLDPDWTRHSLIGVRRE
jgi:hypothetical protein